MTEPMLEATEAKVDVETDEFTDELSDEVLDREQGEARFTFCDRCMVMPPSSCAAITSSSAKPRAGRSDATTSMASRASGRMPRTGCILTAACPETASICTSARSATASTTATRT